MAEVSFKIGVPLFLDLVKCLREFSSEAKFKFSRGGVSGCFLDSANVSMVNFSLDASRFMEYCISEESVLGLNLCSLYDVLRGHKKESLSFFKGDSKAVLRFSGGVVCSLPLLEIDADDSVLPELSFGAEVVLLGKRFRELVGHFGSVGKEGCVVFCVGGGVFKLSSDGVLLDSFVELEQDCDVAVKGEGVGKYSCEYLNNMAKTFFAEKVKLCFGNDYPLMLSQEINGFKVVYVLAPRVDSE